MPTTTGSHRDTAAEFDRMIIEEFRANGGRVGGELANAALILLHHLDARTGSKRVTPLACFPQADGRYLIVASNGGSARHPGWYHNLRAHPTVTVELGSETFTAHARELDPDERDQVWPSLVAATPTLGDYQRRTARRIPVLLLAPVRESVALPQPFG